MDKKYFDEYLNTRYKDQISWYNSKSEFNKKLYSIFQWAIVVLSPIVPIMVGFIPQQYKWITIIVSTILAVCTAGLKAFKYQENWINYRTIAESLKKEKYYYEAHLSDYSKSEDKEALFVERVESLISRENTLWVLTHTQKEDEQGGKAK